jgi:hypothetical protein
MRHDHLGEAEETQIKAVVVLPLQLNLPAIVRVFSYLCAS